MVIIQELHVQCREIKLLHILKFWSSPHFTQEISIVSKNKLNKRFIQNWTYIHVITSTNFLVFLEIILLHPLCGSLIDLSNKEDIGQIQIWRMISSKISLYKTMPLYFRRRNEPFTFSLNLEIEILLNSKKPT